MAKYQFEIDGDATVESIASSFALFASTVIGNRFPDHEEWVGAMAEVVRVINENVRQAGELAAD